VLWAQLTVTLVPEALAVGVLPVGIERALP
jgi:hypothetical protein